MIKQTINVINVLTLLRGNDDQIQVPMVQYQSMILTVKVGPPPKP